ncbi:MAG: hypothetical protein WBQ69_12675 [Gallionella sp.]
MTLKSDHKPNVDEIKFTSELGWFATLAIVVVALAPYIFFH